ncbi:MAG TPA: hypothetical protein VGA06_01665 [Candidatus Paceibacterota bacterium]|jgi:hypothetical protein
MDLTLFLTQILGIYMLVGGASALCYPDRARRAMEEVSKSYVLPYFDGALALILGLLIVLVHNVWEGLPAIIVTLIGWLAVVEGFAMMLLPQNTLASIARSLSNQRTIKMWAAVALVVGAYLTYVGFFM